MNFFMVLGMGVFVMSFALSFLPSIAVMPQKFGLLFGLGCSFMMGSLSIIRGGDAFMKYVTAKGFRLWMALVYAIGFTGMLWCWVTHPPFSHVFIIAFSIAELVSVLYFLIMYTPGFKRLLSRLIKKCWWMLSTQNQSESGIEITHDVITRNTSTAPIQMPVTGW